MTRQHTLIHVHINKKTSTDWLDKVAVWASFVYPAMGIPQLVEIIKNQASGVSIASWLGFAVFSLFFMIYGIVHKIKPMIITYILWVIIDLLVVAAAVLPRAAN